MFGEDLFDDPGLPPFYNAALNVASMTEKQWEYYLLEEHVIMEPIGRAPQLKKCRVERVN